MQHSRNRVSDDPGAIHFVGSFYLVTIVQDQRPVLSVAVSALASDVTINSAGRLQRPNVFGNEFRVRSIRPGDEFPISPELAARIGAEQTGARISAPPTLVAPPAGSALPQFGRWLMQLDRSVTSTDGRTVDAIYVDHAGKVLLPATTSLPEQRRLVRASDGLTELVSLKARPGRAHRLLPTTFTRSPR